MDTRLRKCGAARGSDTSNSNYREISPQYNIYEKTVRASRRGHSTRKSWGNIGVAIAVAAVPDSTHCSFCVEAELYFSVYSESRSALSKIRDFQPSQKHKPHTRSYFATRQNLRKQKTNTTSARGKLVKKFNLTKFWHSTFKIHTHTHVSPLRTTSARISRRMACGMNILESNLKVGHGMLPMAYDFCR